MSAEGAAATTGWEVTVDRLSCSGTGMCVHSASGHFALVNGRSQPVGSPVPPDDAVLDAAENCPLEAIRVVDVATGRVLAPEED
ncbi:ferredoxin [Streptomyces sp. NA04227]|uniref:ferredoxin n=1 Tax=Streptomyces sp. NA04227 TaxID=2742136 RepID=UPI00159136B8|nr:ferredoxin [Streptomyces sp. NA04227]QKW05109.1 ferredoxin [Streptomyces sp. NA04227]